MCRKLANLLYRSDCSVVMDDVNYFTFDGSFMPENENFYFDDRAECQDDVLYVGLEKFPKKILVNIAVSSKGFSEPLFRQTKS